MILTRTCASRRWCADRPASGQALDEAFDPVPDGCFVQVEVLKNRVPVRSGRRRLPYGGDELLVGEAEVGGCAWQLVLGQPAGEEVEHVVVVTQVIAEQRPEAGKLTVPGS